MNIPTQTTADVQRKSLWTSTTEVPVYATLRDNLRADVCIVGAGFAGLSCGYMLARAGSSVVIVDDGPLAGGMSSFTTAHLVSAVDDWFVEIERVHGEHSSRLVAQSHARAIDQIESIVQNERIECDFERVNGYLFQPPLGSEQYSEGRLDQELAAAKRAGLLEASMLDRAPLTSFDTGPCIRFPNQAQFHPLKYLVGLAKAIERQGGRIYTNSHVNQVSGGDHAQVTTDAGHTVSCSSIVVATNTPVNTLVAIHTKQAPYMSYVIGALVEKGVVPKCLLWDMMTPYHYVRLGGDATPNSSTHSPARYEILIVGGEDHKTGQEVDVKERYDRLERWTRERFPIQAIEFKWAGQIFEPVDGVAFIGRNPMDHDNVYIITGDSGMGITHGTIAGMLLTDLIAGRDNEWAALYDPSRKSLRSIGTFVKENVNVASQYLDWLTPGEIKDVSEIPSGSGAIMRRGPMKVAIYRDSSGELHEFSAVCPHLGCIVAWNASEDTWDCPCHGSRFDKLGEVIVGPANRNLTRRETRE